MKLKFMDNQLHTQLDQVELSELVISWNFSLLFPLWQLQHQSSSPDTVRQWLSTTPDLCPVSPTTPTKIETTFPIVKKKKDWVQLVLTGSHAGPWTSHHGLRSIMLWSANPGFIWPLLEIDWEQRTDCRPQRIMVLLPEWGTDPETVKKKNKNWDSHYGLTVEARWTGRSPGFKGWNFIRNTTLHFATVIWWSKGCECHQENSLLGSYSPKCRYILKTSLLTCINTFCHKNSDLTVQMWDLYTVQINRESSMLDISSSDRWYERDPKSCCYLTAKTD